MMGAFLRMMDIYEKSSKKNKEWMFKSSTGEIDGIDKLAIG
jgi:hypothetical protein